MLLEAESPIEARQWVECLTYHWQYRNDRLLQLRLRGVEHAPAANKHKALVSVVPRSRSNVWVQDVLKVTRKQIGDAPISAALLQHDCWGEGSDKYIREDVPSVPVQSYSDSAIPQKQHGEEDTLQARLRVAHLEKSQAQPVFGVSKSPQLGIDECEEFVLVAEESGFSREIAIQAYRTADGDVDCAVDVLQQLHQDSVRETAEIESKTESPFALADALKKIQPAPDEFTKANLIANLPSRTQAGHSRSPSTQPTPRDATTSVHATPRQTENAASSVQSTPRRRLSKQERLAAESALMSAAPKVAPPNEFSPTESEEPSVLDPLEALRLMQQGKLHSTPTATMSSVTPSASVDRSSEATVTPSSVSPPTKSVKSKRKLSKKERMALEASMMNAPNTETPEPAPPPQNQSNAPCLPTPEPPEDPLEALRAMQQGQIDQYGRSVHQEQMPVASRIARMAQEAAAKRAARAAVDPPAVDPPAVDPIAALRAMQQGQIDEYGEPLGAEDCEVDPIAALRALQESETQVTSSSLITPANQLPPPHTKCPSGGSVLSRFVRRNSRAQ